MRYILPTDKVAVPKRESIRRRASSTKGAVRTSTRGQGHELRGYNALLLEGVGASPRTLRGRRCTALGVLRRACRNGHIEFRARGQFFANTRDRASESLQGVSHRGDNSTDNKTAPPRSPIAGESSFLLWVSPKKKGAREVFSRLGWKGLPTLSRLQRRPRRRCLPFGVDCRGNGFRFVGADIPTDVVDPEVDVIRGNVEGQRRRRDLHGRLELNVVLLPRRRNVHHLFAVSCPGVGREFRLEVDLFGGFGFYEGGEGVLCVRLELDVEVLEAGVPEVGALRGDVDVAACVTCVFFGGVKLQGRRAVDGKGIGRAILKVAVFEQISRRLGDAAAQRQREANA